MQKKAVLGIEEKITKKIPLLQDTHKSLKKMVIDLDLDSDGKISLDMIGSCIDMLVREKNETLKVECEKG
ncbi:MAG: hypothetical protein WC656_01530 [Sulfurimonas sp.]|jgi:hypothetical protein